MDVPGETPRYPFRALHSAVPEQTLDEPAMTANSSHSPRLMVWAAQRERFDTMSADMKARRRTEGNVMFLLVFCRCVNCGDL